LWGDALCVFVVTARHTHQPWGIIRAHAPTPSMTVAVIDAWLDPTAVAGGWAIEAWMLGFRHLFDHWPFGALRLELPDFDHAPVASADQFLWCDEGTLGEHLWHQGRYSDLHIRSLPRPEWEEHQPILLPDGLTAGRGSTASHT